MKGQKKETYKTVEYRTRTSSPTKQGWYYGMTTVNKKINPMLVFSGNKILYVDLYENFPHPSDKRFTWYGPVPTCEERK